MRLLGSASAAHDPVPGAFVLDIQVKPGDGDTQSDIEGWFASIAAPAVSGEVSGHCVEQHCAVTIAVPNAKLTLTGPLADPAGGAAHYGVKDDDGKETQSGAATLSALTDPVPGLGPLAAPDAIDEADLEDLLLWGQQSVSTGSPPTGALPSDTQHEALASWQGSKDRLATGLIFIADLDQLRRERDAAQKAAGWTLLGDPALGWSAGYPAALLPIAGPAKSFSSADGKARLVVVIDPPMTSDAFDSLVEQLTADRPGRGNMNSVRTNGDLEMRFEEAGIVTVAEYHNREAGVGRLVLTYPADRADTFGPFEAILQHQFKAGDDLKP